MSGPEDPAGLQEYRRKRSSSSSAEPTGAERQLSTDGVEQPIFVIQRHDASSLHFDFRLQIGPVLVSWAVPKGPSLNPSVKRLATRTEDHPLEYAAFEGVIARGDYGGGTVIVWDTGVFENLTEQRGTPVAAAQALDNGHLKVRLFGEKLTGAFALTRTAMNGDERIWLLVKVDDESADRRRAPERTQLRSVLSGRTNDQLKRQAQRRR